MSKKSELLALKMESLGIVPEPISEQASLIQASSAPEQPLVIDNADTNSANIPNVPEQVAQ